MSARNNSSNIDSKIIPRITINSNDDKQLKFTISGVNVSIINAIRRIILSEIPIVVFRVSPNELNKCNIIANTCGLNNEIVKHRLSCIPIHIKNIDEFPLKNYMLEVNVQNNTETTIYVTTKDFVIIDTVSGKPISQDKIDEIFPPDNITGDYIDFVRLKAKPSDDIQAKSIHLTCEFDIGTAKEDSVYNVVSKCSYGNTVDVEQQETLLQQLKQKWKDEGKNEKEVEFEVENWKLLEGKRIYLKDSFDFVIQSIGIYTNNELITMACQIMIDKLNKLNNIIEKNELEIKSADSTMQNCFDIILENEDYTIGKVIEYFLLINYYDTKIVKFCGFKMLHPHDKFSIIRVAYAEPVEVSTINGQLKDCIDNAIDVYSKIKV